MEIAEQGRVHTLVFLGHPAEADWEGFGLRVEIEVEGCEDDEIIRAAHEVFDQLAFILVLRADRSIQFCPFSRALVHGINVKVTKVH